MFAHFCCCRSCLFRFKIMLYNVSTRVLILIFLRNVAIQQLFSRYVYLPFLPLPSLISLAVIGMIPINGMRLDASTLPWLAIELIAIITNENTKIIRQTSSTLLCFGVMGMFLLLRFFYSPLQIPICFSVKTYLTDQPERLPRKVSRQCIPRHG